MCAKADVFLVLWDVAMMPEKCVWVSRKRKSLGVRAGERKENAQCHTLGLPATHLTRPLARTF